MAEIPEQGPTSGNSRATVLIVDDIEANRRLLARYLSKRNFSVLQSEGGKAALEAVDLALPDLVLLDIMMPDIDGLEVLRRLRKSHSAGELPVIMVTALDNQKSVVEALEAGANDYLTKPIDFPVLDARCASQLERKAAEQAVRELNAELERRVQTRTAELRRAYNVLREESEERKRAQALLRESEEIYRTLYDDNPTTFLTVDDSFTIVSVNKFGARRLGFEVDELVGAELGRIHSDEDGEIVKAAIAECMANAGETRTWEARMRHYDDSTTWARSTGKYVIDRNGGKSVLVVCEDITEARHLSQQLSFEARHDALTGLYNRREFELRLQRALDSTKEDKSVQHTLCYIDLDQFKVINDNCGHVGGDELLRQLATALKKRLRGGDIIARLGGDEFGIMLANCGAEFAARVADDIRRAVSEFRFAWDGKNFTLGASIGVVTIDETMDSISQVMLAADTACYAAKDAGRDRIHVYRPDDDQLEQRHGEMQWVIRIKRALEQNRFKLYVQPIVPLVAGSGESLHYEVLIRLKDEKGNIVPPGAFLPAAERYNISKNIDRRVVNSTLAWLQDHPQHVDELDVCSINLSGQTLGDKLMLNEIMASLSESSVPAEKLCFEITETAAIANLHVAQEFIAALKDRGCLFALDDFGSGLSSFAYLKNLPVDFLKIDGIFVRNIVEDPVSLAIVRSINEVGKVMGQKTIAEFVENDAITAKLRGIGVDYGQGYGIGKPMAIDELIAPQALKIIAGS